MIKLSIATANRPYVAAVALIAVAQTAVKHIRAPRAEEPYSVLDQ